MLEIKIIYVILYNSMLLEIKKIKYKKNRMKIKIKFVNLYKNMLLIHNKKKFKINN